MPVGKELIGMDLNIFEDNGKNEAAHTKETSFIIYTIISHQKIN
jgi:hypothetical protein